MHGPRSHLVLLIVGALTLSACGGTEQPVPVPRTSSPSPTAAETPSIAPTEDQTSTPAPETTTTEAPPPADVDWLNTTFRMRAYSGSELENLAFANGVAQQTVIVHAVADPADPMRVAMVSTSADSEGYPLFVNAGIFALGSSGVAEPEALDSTMNGAALAVALCDSQLTWDGGDSLALDVEACGYDASEPQLGWTREGEVLRLDDGTD